MQVKRNQPEGFRERLYDVFIKSGITITDIAKRTGVSRSLIYGYLYDDVVPSVTILVKLCAIFNVSSDYLLFGKKVG